MMIMKVPASADPRIVVLGGGFGGLNLAKGLRNMPYQVILIDEHNYHTFQSLFYQVATGGLELPYPFFSEGSEGTGPQREEVLV